MSKKKRNVFVAMIMAMLLAVAGCASPAPSTPAPSDNAPAPSQDVQATPEATQAPAEKTKITFWYLWGGTEGAVIDEVIKAYNEQSDWVEVEGLSVPDSQKILAAIAAGNGPDVVDDFSSGIGKMASTGVLEPLDGYVEKTQYDLSKFVPAAIESCKMDGTLYSLPISMNLMALYYNKTLLEEAGYSEPPKTLEEMYEMAVATTKVNSDGTLDVAGFPDFPFVYYTANFATAAGGGWYAPDGGPAPADNYGNRYALELARKYREEFGLENVVRFQAAGKYFDPTDPFVIGKQTFRVDGPWTGKNIREVLNSDVNYGVTFIPYPQDHPEFEGRGLTSSSTMYIASNSKQKDAAWDFISWFSGEGGQSYFTAKMGAFPSYLPLLDNEQVKSGYDMDFYIQLAQSPNLVSTPNGPNNGEYETMVGEQVEMCVSLSQDVDTTLKNIYDQGLALLK